MQKIKSINANSQTIEPSFENVIEVEKQEETVTKEDLIIPQILEPILVVKEESRKEKSFFTIEEKKPKNNPFQKLKKKNNNFWKWFIFWFMLFITLNILAFFQSTQTFFFNQYVNTLKNNITVNDKKITKTNLNMVSAVDRFSINLLDREEDDCLEIANFNNLSLFPKSERVIIEKDKSFVRNKDLSIIINQYYQELENYNLQLTKLEKYNQEIQSIVIDNVSTLEKLCNNFVKLSLNNSYVNSDNLTIKNILTSLSELETKIINPELPNFANLLKIIQNINKAEYSKIENYSIVNVVKKNQNKNLLVKELKLMIEQLLNFVNLTESYTNIANKPDSINTVKTNLLTKIEEINNKDFKDYPLKVNI